MGGKNRAKKLAGAPGTTRASTKKSASVKVSNKKSNKAKKQAGEKSELSRGKDVDEKRAAKLATKSVKQAARREGAPVGESDGLNAESRKKAKRSHGAKASGVSVKQQKQHAHEPHAMARHDAAYNERAQAKAARRAGVETPAEESARLRAEEEKDPEANEADHRFFDKNAGMLGFLDNLDAAKLTVSKEDRNKPKAKFPQPQPKAKSAAESDEDDDDEEEDESEDEDEPEEEDDDDDEDDLPPVVKKNGAKSVSLSNLESRPRVPSWASAAPTRAGADRLPIREADGSWGSSQVQKWDRLRERAEMIESQKGQVGQPKVAQVDADADVDMSDAEDAITSPVDSDQDEEEDEEAAELDHDDEIANDILVSEDDEDLEGELEVEQMDELAAPEGLDERKSNKVKEQQERRQYRLKAELAETSEMILENPEKNIGKLEPMLQLCTDVDLTIQQVAIMSCVEVLVDLMPTYRIRLPTDEEFESKLGKDTKATWKFERMYLLYYGRLVNLILTYLRNLFPAATRDRLEVSQLQMNLLKCGAKLLEKGHAFNYRKELIHGMTSFLNHVSPKIRLLLFQTLVGIFRGDISGETTLEMVKILTKLVKEKGKRIQSEVLQIFLYLPLHKDILEANTGDDADDKKKKAAAQPHSKKKKYVHVDEKELSRDLAEGEATVSIATRKKIQTQLLTELFTAYFRILKAEKNSKHLPTVLKGLSKFATLIDIEIVLDLLDCLKATISEENEETLSVESSLYCILTSFTTLQSHGQSLQLDLKEFYNSLYSILYRFTSPEEVKFIPLLLQCLHLMFQDTKQLSIERVASFVKRLSTLCLYVPPYAALSIMHAVRLCLNKYPKVKQLLDREATASGLHLAEIDDPDLANSFASTAWELGLQKSSYHPFLPIYATSILHDEQLPLSLTRTSPQDLFETYDTSEGGFNPPLPLPIMFSNIGPAGMAVTTNSMKKKLDLKRRILVQQLAAAQKNERLQTPFLRSAIEISQRQKQLGGQCEKSIIERRQQLEHLKQLTQRWKAHQQKKRPASGAANESQSAKKQKTKR